MPGWITKHIEKAGWAQFAVWVAILVVFSFWAFNMDSPWTRALALAGGELPETQPGIPAIEPARSLAALGASTGDYILWQALDIPYAIMNLMVAWIGIGLGLKAMRLDKSLLRFLMILPPVYVACEIVENALVAGFAAKTVPASETFVLIQQAATTLKFASGMPALALGALGAIITALAFAIRRLRRQS